MTKTDNDSKCYLCGDNSVSDEHVPAKCFFPKDRRINLLTVRSCQAHNGDTSKDDEYTRNIVAMSLGNNNVALQHFLTACVKSFLKSPKLLARTTAIQKEVFLREKGATKLQRGKAIQIERERIDLVMRKIAYAIFFRENGARWNRNLIVATEHLREGSMAADAQGVLIQAVKPLLRGLTFKGNNPEVFQHTFVPTKSADLHDSTLMMRFYEGFEVWMIPQPGTTEPSL